MFNKEFVSMAIVIFIIVVTPFVMLEITDRMNQKTCPYGKLTGVILRYECEGLSMLRDDSNCKRVIEKTSSNHCLTEDPAQWDERVKKFHSIGY